MKYSTQKVGGLLTKVSPAALTCLSIAGVVGTAVTAVTATPKAMMLVEQKKREMKLDKLPKKEAACIICRCYIPSALVGLATAICIVGIGSENRRSRASLISAYAMLNDSYKKYRNAARSVYGEDADERIHAEMAVNACVRTTDWGYQSYDMEMDSGSERVLFYDLCSQRYFNATLAAVLNAQYHINRNLQLRGYCSLNEYYSFLGIGDVKDGDEIGWQMESLCRDGEQWLDFDNRKTVLDDGLECIVSSIAIEPTVFDEDVL